MGSEARPSMSTRVLAITLFCFLLSSLDCPAHGFEARVMKEAAGIPPQTLIPPCPLAANSNGTCANLRWYNACSGYIWIYSGLGGQGVGVRFGGPEDPCVWPGNTVKRAITYFRNTVPNYAQTVDVYLDADTNSDGCPDRVLASDIGLDPGLRWNCSNFNVAIPSDAASLIVRTVDPAAGCGAAGAPNFVTDGPYSESCAPVGAPRSFYYGINGTACIPWREINATDRDDNFLYWLIIDGTPNPVEPTTWGNIKSTYR